MSAPRTTTRVRGYAPWKPQKATVLLLDNVLAVLDEYREYLPLTLRQLFYRLVGAHDYPKTEAAYEGLGEKVNRARRSGMIPWSAIRDDRPTVERPHAYRSPRDYLGTVEYLLDADAYRRDRRDGQPVDLWVACEASGMVPMITKAVADYGVTVVSSGGFDSTTMKRELAMKSRSRPLTVLHVGDHDPSGVHLYQSFAEDVAAFAQAEGGAVDFERIAVLPAHIDQFQLPTAPPKPGDRRAFTGETVQAEALPPDVLVRLITQAVERHTDMDALARLLDTEADQRQALAEQLAPLRELLEDES